MTMPKLDPRDTQPCFWNLFKCLNFTEMWLAPFCSSFGVMYDIVNLFIKWAPQLQKVFLKHSSADIKYRGVTLNIGAHPSLIYRISSKGPVLHTSGKKSFCFIYNVLAIWIYRIFLEMVKKKLMPSFKHFYF